MYNPLVNKNPVGAVVAGQKFLIEFPVPEDYKLNGVSLILLEWGRAEDNSIFVPLVFAGCRKEELVYRAEASVESAGIYSYRFEGYSDEGILFFGRGADGTATRGDWLPNWQLTVTEKDIEVPEHAKSGIIYHIFADRFYKAKDIKFSKDGTLHKSWQEKPVVAEIGETYLANDFFGGDILGITEKLDYLKSLSVTMIYLSPIFESYSNHRYDTGNYLKIDPLLGTEKDFKTLIKEAKKRGMTVMLDGVFNHTGADSLYFNQKGTYPTLGAAQSRMSPYYDWYYFGEHPDKYRCWWGVQVVPTVNKRNPDFRELIFGKGGVIDKWTGFGVKGWRIDVVDELPEDFVFSLREKIKQKDKDCLLIGEVWEDASTKVSYGTMRPYLLGRQLDGVMNYPFKNAIIDYVKTAGAEKFKDEITKIVEHYPKACLDVSMTMIGSHDTARALTVLSDVSGDCMSKTQKNNFKLSKEEHKAAIERLKLAAVLQYTLPGIPAVYYGDEAGVQGFEDPMNRAPYPWGGEDKRLLAFYKKLGALRTDNKELLKGGVRLGECRDGVVVFHRYTDGQVMSIAVNASSEVKKIKLKNREVSLKPMSYKISVKAMLTTKRFF